MKYKEYIEDPTSVSLFVEKNSGVTRYRVSLEIKNDGTDRKTMATYHSHLDIPKEDGMVYVSGSNEWGNPAVISDSAEDIKNKINAGEVRKVQLCVYVEPADEKKNEQYDAEIMASVKKIIPYYEHVIGKAVKAPRGRAWLLTWNPANWTWDNYEEWCVDTKNGNTHEIAWRCASNQRLAMRSFLSKLVLSQEELWLMDMFLLKLMKHRIMIRIRQQRVRHQTILM